ncbi:benzoate carboxyl methyltransferase-like protein [Tanacetum coccineum]
MNKNSTTLHKSRNCDKKVEPIIEETVKSIANFYGFPQCFNIGDLGCSSGPNTLLAISNFIDEMHEVGKEKNFKPLNFQGSFNERLFPDQSIHLFHSSSSLHWLSQVGVQSTLDPCSSGSGRVSELVVKSLVDAINEGLVRESDIYSLNVPLYYA